MIKSTLLAVSAVVAGVFLFSPVSQQSAQAQMLGGLKDAADNSNLVTLVRRGGGGGRGGISRGGGGRAGIARGGGGRAKHAYRGGGRAKHAYRGGGGRYAYAGGGRRYANRDYRGRYDNRRHYGNYDRRYYGNWWPGKYRRYGYYGAGAYYYGSTNCDWLYRHNYRRWLTVCQ